MFKKKVSRITEIIYRVIKRLTKRQQLRFNSRRYWRNAAHEDKIQINYGFTNVPGCNQLLSGGLVKLQDLHSRFPANNIRPNLLYLVSSSLPQNADIHIRSAFRYRGVFVLNQNGVGYPGWHGPGWEQFNHPMIYAHSTANFVIYQSAFCKRSAELFLGQRQGPSTILYNPVNTNTFTPAEKLPSNGPILLLAGTHQFRYRVERAMQTLSIVLKILPQARLIIAGNHIWTSPKKARQILDLIATELNCREAFDWEPPYAQVDAPALFRRAHILLHTKYNDPCPRLVVEAMACGLPIVFSATGGVPELVGKDSGAGVPGPEDYYQDHPPDPEALANCVYEIWSNYHQYRKAARKRAVEHLNVQSWLDEHEMIFQNLLDSRNNIKFARYHI